MKKPSEQVAALPFRRTSAGLEIMLITSRGTGRYVIPKGWPMEGKTDYEAAAIEAFEEAGITGEIAQTPCGSYTYEKRKKSGRLVPTQVIVYALHVKSELEIWPEKHQRRRQWFAKDEAAKLVDEPELQIRISNFKIAQCQI